MCVLLLLLLLLHVCGRSAVKLEFEGEEVAAAPARAA